MKEMTEEEIAAKHIRIRGTLQLKYPKDGRCRKTCGELHCFIQTRNGRNYIAHPCFLAMDHIERCQFSSECDAETSPVTVVTGVAA